MTHRAGEQDALSKRGSKKLAAQEDQLFESDVMNEHLGNMREMCIRGQNSQSVLHGTGSNPEVVRGNRPTDCPEAVQNDRIPLGCFLVHGQHVDTR